MTIAESTLGVTNPGAQSFANNIGQLQTAALNEPALSEGTSLGETFSKLFNGVQQANQPINSQGILSAASSEENLGLIQQSIFTSLGFGSLTSESALGSLEQLTSQSSIETMQASFLSSLQSSIFSPQPAPVTTNNLAETGSITSNKNTTINIYNTGTTKVSDISTTSDTTEVSIADDIANYSFGDDGFDAKDGFEIFNVLNQIPVVSSIYEDVSEKEIAAVSKLTGGLLFGGAFGLAFSALGLAIEGYTGTSVSDAIAHFDYSGLFDSEDIQTEQLQNSVKESAKETKIEYFSAADQIAQK
jgi:hypothetical protein